MASGSQTASSNIDNAATRTIVSTLGVLLGVSSINHGLPEVLQGNHSTPGLFVKALGPGHQWTVWTQGSEPAFTLIPNFLLTGILATLFGVLLIICSRLLIHRPYGPSVFLLLSISSFLTGGGLAQVLLFTLNWAAATRIHGSLSIWRRLVPKSARPALGKFWRWPLVVGTVAFLAALEIAIFGYILGVPGRPEVLRGILVQLGFVIVISFLASFLCGFAHDIEGHAASRQECLP